MCGTQGEKDHLVYKEEDGSHLRLDYEFHFDGLFIHLASSAV